MVDSYNVLLTVTPDLRCGLIAFGMIADAIGKPRKCEQVLRNLYQIQACLHRLQLLITWQSAGFSQSWECESWLGVLCLPPYGHSKGTSICSVGLQWEKEDLLVLSACADQSVKCSGSNSQPSISPPLTLLEVHPPTSPDKLPEPIYQPRKDG